MEKYTLNQIKEKKLKRLEISFETDKTAFQNLKEKIFNKKQETNEENAILLAIRQKEIEVAPNDVLEKYITNKEKLVPELKKYLSCKCSNEDVKFLYKIDEDTISGLDGETKTIYVLFTRVENLHNGLYNVKSWIKYDEKNILGRIIKGTLRTNSCNLEFINKDMTFNELKDFKENINEFKKVDLEKLDEMAEEIYKGYIEFEIEPLETNSLDELF